MKKKTQINIGLMIGIILVSLVVLVCMISFVYLPMSPTDMDASMRFLKPSDSIDHMLGTDQFGRDIFSRMLIGSRSVLLVGVVSVLFGAVVGSLLGAIAGIFKGYVSPIIMRGIDGLMAFPGILLAMMMVAVIGKGQNGAIIAISIFMIPIFTRLVYSMILENENMLFVKAAKSHGISKTRLLFKHYLPIFLPKLITQISSCVGSAIMIETSLSFLGLGIQPPNPSWGYMLYEAQTYFLQYSYLAVAPGVAIAITVLGFNLLGDGLNDVLLNRRSDV